MSVFEDLGEAIRHQPRNKDFTDPVAYRRARWAYSSTERRLKETLMNEWAARRGVVPAGGYESFHRLHGRYPRSMYSSIPRLPCDDHVSMWRERGARPHFIKIYVSQPYDHVDDPKYLAEMERAARRWELAFTVSDWPAWHYPGRVKFVEWTRGEPIPASNENALRRLIEFPLEKVFKDEEGFDAWEVTVNLTGLALHGDRVLGRMLSELGAVRLRKNRPDHPTNAMLEEVERWLDQMVGHDVDGHVLCRYAKRYWFESA